MTDPIKVALVDDQQLVRAGFAMVINASDDMTVVGEADTGRAAIDLLDSTDVDVMLMDIRMPVMDGVTATTHICQQTGSPVRVIVLTTFDLDEYAYAALEAGASGFLLKDAGPQELIAAIRAVHRGDAVIAPSTTRRMISHLTTAPPPISPDTEKPCNAADHPKIAPLTAREREVLAAVARGLTNTAIANELFIAEATVKTHISRILAKCQLRDRVHMVLLAYETGLVAPPT